MITDKSVTTLISVDELLCNLLDCHDRTSSCIAFDTVFNILKLFDYIY
ncbi:MAG: hypothetical protein IJV35_10340 [Neisseriaceae bacterium]|nr:hypothetical protein [Neisseriaceae bacterium]